MARDPQPHLPIEALTAPSIRARRARQVEGLARRTLLRRALGAGIGLLALEAVGGTIAFAWSAAGGVGGKVRIGTLADLVAANPGIPIMDGFPVYVADARAFVIPVDPSRGGWQPGVDLAGDGTALNVGLFRRSVRISAAGQTRAWRTTGSTAPATSRATTGSGSSRPLNVMGRRTAAWIGSRPRWTPMVS